MNLRVRKKCKVKKREKQKGERVMISRVGGGGKRRKRRGEKKSERKRNTKK